MNSLTSEYVFEVLAPELIASTPGLQVSVDAVLAIELTGEGGGAWTFDLRNEGRPDVRRGSAAEAECSVTMNALDFLALLTGGRLSDWLAAFKQGRIEFHGHLPTFLKLERLYHAALEDPTLAKFSRYILDGELSAVNPWIPVTSRRAMSGAVADASEVG